MIYQVNGYQQNQINSYEKPQLIEYDQDHSNEFQQNSTDFQHNHVTGYTRGALVEQYSEYDDDPYLEAQESIESYVEEDVSNGELFEICFYI